MTLRRRVLLARSAGLDARLAADVIRAGRRRLSGGPRRVGISYPLPDATEDRLLARGIADALDDGSTTVLLLPLVNKTLRPRKPAIDTMLLLSPITHAAELPRAIFVVAWVRTTVAAWPTDLLKNADLVLAGSASLADEIAALTGLAPATMPPAVAASALSQVPGRELDLVHFGDGQRNAARLARYLGSSTTSRVRVYGPNWEQDGRFTQHADRPSAVPDKEEIFRRSRILIGLADNRRRSLDPDLMRAAVCGALPITDDSEATADIFGPLLPSFSDRHELQSLLDGAADEAQRTDTVRELATAIVANHTYAVRASEIAQRIAEEQHKPLVAVKICPPNTNVMESWGDTHFGRQFARGLRRNGLRAAVHIRPNWYDGAVKEDIAVHVRGLEPYEPQPGSLNLLWIISHPDDISPEECNRYDAVMCASSTFAAALSTQVAVPVHTMHQAADPAVFCYTAAQPALRSDMLFVGNARLPVRQVPRWLLELDEPLTIYGARWHEVAERRFVQGEFVANDALHELYRSSDIVVNDHWADMRKHGFISNRVFDALACGAFVISDHLDAIPELFGDNVPTFSTRDELAAVLAIFKPDPAERARRALNGRRIVLEHHTFDVRAGQLREIINQLAPDMLPTPQ